MKQTFLALILLTCIYDGWGQSSEQILSHKIPVTIDSAEASQVLDRVSDELGFKLSYDASLLRDRVIVFSTDTLSVQELLQTVFERVDLEIRLIGSQMVIFEQADPFDSDSCNFSLEGTIVDKLTGQGLPRAFIKDRVSGRLTATNRDGTYILGLPCTQDSVDLSVIVMGYHSRIINAAAELRMDPIEMEGTYVALPQMVVISVSPTDLVGRVLEKVESNYMYQPTNTRAFFREAIIKNTKLAALSETVLDVYNSSYAQSHKTDVARLVKGRRIINPIFLDTVEFKIKGSLKSCFQLDVIKNPPVFLQFKEFDKSYVFSHAGVWEMGEKSIYAINFKRRPNGEGLPFQGTLYIDIDRLTLNSVEFELDKNAFKSANEQFVVKRARGTNTRFLGAQYYVRYTEVNGKFAMNYVSLKAKFKVRKEKKLFFAEYETLSEYVVNQFETENVYRIKPKDAFTVGKVLLDQPINYNVSFWQGLSYLPVDKPLLEASEQLQKVFGAQ